MRDRRIAVVGGGILGMFLALRLRQAGAEVTLLEAAARTGGLTEPQPIGAYSWDRFYHVVLLSDGHTRALLAELGIEGELHFGLTRTGFFTDGALYSLSNGLEFLRFPPLTLLQKLRLGVTIARAALIRDGVPLESIPVETWLERWSGKRVLERIWRPLLRAKLGDNYRLASAAFIWAVIARMYAARRSGLKREMMGYVEGGYARVLERLQQRLDATGVRTRLSAQVAAIEDRDGAALIRLAGGESLAFDTVVSTLPAGVSARLCPQLRAEERARLAAVVYQGIVCASLLLERPLSGYYVTNITDGWVPFTGVIEMTALVDRSRFGGHSLVYLPCYLTQDDPRWQDGDAQIRERFLAAMERMYPHFRRDQVLDFRIARARNVLAIATLDYSARLLPPVETSLANVFIVNSAQIANGTLNVNETLGVVHRQLPRLLARLGGAAAVARA